ncbi:nitrogen fixation protein NifM [Vibrio sp. MA40-2]|uniref:nitrogen fixation protein NifM n=1 Tax=Vibrio sp. MA40-2 TaxID=3391828 RepID=UPI0039A4FFA5
MVKIATDKFEMNPDYLSEDQQGIVDKKVKQLAHINNSILRTAEAQQVQVSASELLDAYQQCQKQFESEQAFYATLKQQGLTVEGFKVALRQELHCDKVMEYVAKDVPELDKSRALEYYSQHKTEFSRDKTWKLSQILITINDQFPDNTRAKALARITRIQAEAQQTPFSTLALSHSECPSALHEGLLGWCEEGKLYPEIAEAIHSLPIGQISSPIETEIGFHLLLCHEVKPAQVATFEEVWPFLQKKHTARAKQYLQRQWLNNRLAHS